MIGTVVNAGGHMRSKRGQWCGVILKEGWPTRAEASPAKEAAGQGRGLSRQIISYLQK